MATSTRQVILIENVYSIGSETLPSTCYILSDESKILFYSTSNAISIYKPFTFYDLNENQTIVLYDQLSKLVYCIICISLWTAIHVVAKRARERAKTTTIYSRRIENLPLWSDRNE